MSVAAHAQQAMMPIVGFLHATTPNEMPHGGVRSACGWLAAPPSRLPAFFRRQAMNHQAVAQRQARPAADGLIMSLTQVLESACQMSAGSRGH
jgi:hypothetical protein